MIVNHPELVAVLADVDFDTVDIEVERVAKTVEAVFEALAGGPTVANYVKIFTNFLHLDTPAPRGAGEAR